MIAGIDFGTIALYQHLMADGRIAEARPYVDKFLTHPGREYLYYIYSGDMATLTSDARSALRLWDEAVEKYPNIWQARCDRADRLKKLGRYDETLADYDSCFTMQPIPRMNDGLRSRAQLFEQLGRKEEGHL